MAKRKQQHAEHESSERWLLTYADMITLLMAFFIMLYSMSQLDLKKFAMVAGSVRAELGGTGVLEGAQGVGEGAGPEPGLSGIAPMLGPEVAGRLCQDLESEMRGAKASDVRVCTEDGSVRIRLPGGSVYFEPASATLTTQARQVLNCLARAIRKYPCHLRVEGHTCDLPLRSLTYASGWELSSARALNAAFHLVRQGAAPPARCTFMGYAERRPLVPNTSETNRRRNRRVEIILQPLTADQHTPTAAPGDSTTAVPPPVDITKTGPAAHVTED